MKQLSLLLTLLFCVQFSSAQLYANGKKIRNNIKYVNIYFDYNSKIQVNYGKIGPPYRFYITTEKKVYLTAISGLAVLNYMDSKGWKPAIKGKRLSNFANNEEGWLLFQKK